jgi:hypothetical protein
VFYTVSKRTCLSGGIVSLPMISLSLICGGYRSRTDDPLRARQML